MDDNNNKGAAVASSPSKVRLYLGGGIFLMGQLTPLFIPLVLASNLSGNVKTTLVSLMAICVPELCIIIAIGIMGRDGFDFLKQRIYRCLRIYFKPNVRVSYRRYQVGLVLFIIPLIVGFFMPYVIHLTPRYEIYQIRFTVTCDIMLITSLFVLGGDFWEKLRSLFIYRARITYEDIA